MSNKYRGKNNVFLFDVMANDIMNDNHFCTIHDRLYMWYNGRYITTDIQKKIIAMANMLDSSVSKANAVAVYDKICMYADQGVFTNFKEVDQYRIAFNNGVLDLRDMHFETGLLQQYAIVNKIPYNYNPKAEDQPQIRKMFNELADGNKKIEKVLYEIVGYPMLVNTKLKTAFFLYGSGNCGKSSFMELIQYIYGSKNCTSFQINELNQRFNKALCCNRLLNFSDDIDASFIREPGFLKRLIGGMPDMQVENKGETGYQAAFYSKLIMSMNDFFKIKIDGDDTAYKLRFNIIEFKHEFESNPNYSDWAKENLYTDEAIEWLLYEAAKAIHEVIVIDPKTGKSKGFSYKDDKLVEAFLENSTPLVGEALKMTLDDWNYYYDARRWFDDIKDIYGAQASWSTFMEHFNKRSEKFRIKRTQVKDHNGRRKDKYVVEER